MIRLPCSIISLDLQDIMGSHSVNIHGHLMKYKLDKNGRVIGESQYKTNNPNSPNKLKKKSKIKKAVN